MGVVAFATWQGPALAAGRSPFTFNAAPLPDVRPTTVSFTPFLSTPVGAAGSDLTVGADGNIWIATQGPGLIVRMTPGGVSTAFNYANGGQGASGSPAPVRITAGPDGQLWFTTFTNQNGATLGVGSISTSGAISVGNGRRRPVR